MSADMMTCKSQIKCVPGRARSPVSYSSCLHTISRLPIPRWRCGSLSLATHLFRCRPLNSLIVDETEKWGKVIRTANIKAG